MWMKNKKLRLFRIPIAIYLGLCGVVGGFQRSIIYHPVRQSETQMLTEARLAQCVPWKDASGAIIGWRSVKRAGEPPAANRLLVFHGNAGYALDRTYYVHGFERNVAGRQWEVTLFEYPGYGARPGVISQTSYVKAGLEALKQMRAEDQRPIYLLGESLGSGLACALAKEAPGEFDGLFLFTPYARIGDVGARQLPYLPIRLMLLDPWDNVAALQDYHGPVAMMIAGQDEIVTAAQGHLLYESYHGPKKLWVDPEAEHNSVGMGPNAAWWNEVSRFLLENRGATNSK